MIEQINVYSEMIPFRFSLCDILPLVSFSFPDGHTTRHMEVKWKRGFDKSDVTENNSISLAQFDYMVRFQEEYIEEIAAGQNMTYRGFFFLTF